MQPQHSYPLTVLRSDAISSRVRSLITPLAVAGFLVVATLYLLLIPHWLPYDEPSHFYYVASIVGLPHFPHPGGPGSLDYEMYKQPPLAYLLYSPFLKAAGLEVSTQLVVLRVVSVVLGAITVYVNMRVVQALIGAHRLKTLLLAAAGAVMIFNPAFIAASCTVTNDGLFDLLTALSILLAIYLVRTPSSQRSGWLLIGLGVLVGLDSSTKALGLPLLLLPVVVYAMRATHLTADRGERERASTLWPWLVGALLVGALLAAPYYVYNLLRYDDPFGTKYWHSLPQAHSRRMRLSDVKGIIPLGFATFWFFVNYLRNILPSKPARLEYLPFLALSIAPVAAIVLVAARRGIRSLVTPARLVVAGAVILSAAGFLYKNIDDFGPEGRYLFGVIGPIAWSIAQGVAYLVPSRDDKIKRWILRGIIVFMTVYSVYTGYRYLTHAPHIYPHLYQS